MDLNNIKFKCQNSGKCCVSYGRNGYVFLSDKDAKRLAKFFKISVVKFIRKYCFIHNEQIELKANEKNENCLFLANHKCTVYEARPTQCRTWPFWPENMNAKKWKLVSDFCPGIGKGKKIPAKNIVHYIDLQSKSEHNK